MALPQERVEALIRFYGFDVLGAQEAKPSQMSDRVRCPVSHRWVWAATGRPRILGDLYRTDRLRVLDSGTFWLSETPDTVSKGWDAALNRICTWAKMKDRRTGRVFYFFNTHFDHVGREARLRSAELLAGRIRAVAGDKYPVLCTGDFNAHAESEPVAVMKTVLRDAREASQTPAYGPPFSYAGFPVQVPEKLRNRTPIDYLFVNGRVRVLTCGLLSDSDGRNHPSDHFPLRAVIVFD
ncbi:MAG: endonuclease/exonuclease/phosphatase family protein [Alistipes ihumii]